jgi:hypothetical protein
MRTKPTIKLLKYFRPIHNLGQKPTREDWYPSEGIWQAYSVREEIKSGVFRRMYTLKCVAPFDSPYVFGDFKELLEEFIASSFVEVEFVESDIKEKNMKKELFDFLIKYHDIDLKKFISSEDERNRIFREIKLYSVTK